MTTTLDLVIRKLSDCKTPTGFYKLPCGYLDPQGIIHDDIQIREMTGVEEDILASSGTNIAAKIEAIMANCTVSIGTIADPQKIRELVPKLTVYDRFYILVLIRLISIGDEFPFEAFCGKCNDQSIFTVLLSALDVRELKDKHVRSHDITLPSGRIVVTKLTLGTEEAAIADLAKANPESIASVSLMAKVAALDAKPITMEALKSLSWKDRNALRTSLAGIEYGLDTSVENKCPSCGNIFKIDLELGSSGFFFPSEVGKR